MQPLPPDIREEILKRPGVTETDISNYQSLLVEQSMIDPDDSSQSSARKEIDERLSKLQKKLFSEQSLS